MEALGQSYGFLLLIIDAFPKGIVAWLYDLSLSWRDVQTAVSLHLHTGGYHRQHSAYTAVLLVQALAFLKLLLLPQRRLIWLGRK